MSASRRIKVLVVEDHPVARAGIRSALETCERLQVVAEAETGEEAVLLAHEVSPDVVVMDIELPGMDGLDVTELMRKELPRIKIILLSMHEDTGYVERATHAGVCGYLLKNTPLNELVGSVLAVGGAGAGETMPEMSLPDEKATEELLTERDRTVLKLISGGKSGKEIAEQMGIRSRTVESYRETLKRKLNIRTTAGLTKYAIAAGLVEKPNENEGKG
jgi:two-component system NarL family response regulator